MNATARVAAAVKVEKATEELGEGRVEEEEGF